MCLIFNNIAHKAVGSLSRREGVENKKPLIRTDHPRVSRTRLGQAKTFAFTCATNSMQLRRTQDLHEANLLPSVALVASFLRKLKNQHLRKSFPYRICKQHYNGVLFCAFKVTSFAPPLLVSSHVFLSPFFFPPFSSSSPLLSPRKGLKVLDPLVYTSNLSRKLLACRLLLPLLRARALLGHGVEAECQHFPNLHTDVLALLFPPYHFGTA